MVEWGQVGGMDADEQAILSYLEGYGDQWVNAKEICRRAGGKRRFSDDPAWARPVLVRMKELRLVEADMAGRYRIPPAHESEAPANPEAGEEAGEDISGEPDELD